MEWLTDELHEELAKSKDHTIRLVVAMYSDKYHHLLMNDEDPFVRKAIFYFTNPDAYKE